MLRIIDSAAFLYVVLGDWRATPETTIKMGAWSTIRTVKLNLAEALELSGYPFCGVAALLNKRRHLSL